MMNTKKTVLVQVAISQERMGMMNKEMTEVKQKPIVVKEGSSPAEMMAQVLASGLDLEKAEKYLELQERWEKKEARKSYHSAMADFKSNPIKIEKDKKVDFAKKEGGGRVKYNHSSLANVVDKITIELSKYGLSASWSTKQNGNVIVTCCITHRMGHSEQTTLEAPPDTTGSKNSIQAIGSTISYLQRYTLLSALGLATSDMDNDGSGEDVEKISDKELSNLLDLVVAVESTEGKLLKYMGLEKLEDMPKSEYQRAVAGLEAKKNGNN